jgi:hypothetical protein
VEGKKFVYSQLWPAGAMASTPIEYVDGGAVCALTVPDRPTTTSVAAPVETATFQRLRTTATSPELVSAAF